MSTIRQFNPASSDRSSTTNVLARDEPDDEEDEQEKGDDSEKDEDDDNEEGEDDDNEEGEDDDGYSERAWPGASPVLQSYRRPLSAVAHPAEP